MHILLRDLSEEEGRGEELLIADFTAPEILKVQIVLVSAVVAVTDDRVAEMRELRTDLVSSSCYELDFDIGNIFTIRTCALIGLQYTVTGSDRKIALLLDK